MINKLVNRKRLAHTSSTPGKTRTINLYLIDDSWFLVDLPGYGYAKVSKQEQQRWGQVIEGYLQTRRQLAGVLHLVDLRHDPSQNDVMMSEWLEYYEIPYRVVATKADKISRGRRAQQLVRIRKIMRLKHPAISFSAITGEGMEEVYRAIKELKQGK